MAIDARELRIGNWVCDGEHTQFPMYIRTIAEDYAFLDFVGNESDLWEVDIKDIHGIPLTGETLEKIGFTFKDGLWRNQLGVKVKPEAGFVHIENKDAEHWLYGTCNCKDIWYLHQLQNLIKIITKAELRVVL